MQFYCCFSMDSWRDMAEIRMVFMVLCGFCFVFQLIRQRIPVEYGRSGE